MRKSIYVEGAMLFKKYHQGFLSHLKHFLYSTHQLDINPTQALMIYCIGQHKIKVNDLVKNHFYEGANPSYNIKKMIEADYLVPHPNPQDRRVLLLSLSEKGKALYNSVEQFLETHEKRLESYGVKIQRFQQWIQEGRQWGAFGIAYGEIT